jgi:hypothetical protein
MTISMLLPTGFMVRCHLTTNRRPIYPQYCLKAALLRCARPISTKDNGH